MPAMDSDDTIYALASGRLPAAIAVVRFSGAKTAAILRTLADNPDITDAPRIARLARLYDDDRKPIDEALLIWFPAPNSTTGEDCAELHLHGSAAIVNKIFASLERYGARMAEAGEFTKRAFLHDKLDLTQAEAVQDLVAAETPAQHAQALAQLGGSLFDYYQNLKQRLAGLLAHCEAAIDFCEDEDFAEMMNKLYAQIIDCTREITAHLDDGGVGEKIREGVRIAIVGAPNSGKSTLLNRLAARDIAIAAPTPGTTRDLIEVGLNIAGFAVIVTDTAGIRDSSDPIEQEGIRRSHHAAAEADLTIAVRAVDESETAHDIVANADITLTNKIDLLSDDARHDLIAQTAADPNHIALSLKTDDRLDTLIEPLTARIAAQMTHGGENRTSPTVTRKRYRDILFHVKQCLDAVSDADPPLPIELAAEHLRQAVMLMGRLTGHVDVESLLDIVFRDFCIGK